MPSENSKTGKPHVVYLSCKAKSIFTELRELASGSEWILPGRTTIAKPFSITVLNKALENLHFEMVPFTIHDMRRTGSTILHEGDMRRMSSKSFESLNQRSARSL
jgi:integrase